MAGCPYQIEFAPEKLDEVRIAVVEAYYTVPRGGIEIGGVLLGERDGGVIRVRDYRLIECEHKSGPSFLLSEKDRAGLADAISGSPGEAVGWFHSHTRSEVFLSAADLEIHDKFFPEAWQVAMVLRPGNLQPLRAGYFFRGADGKITGDKGCREFVVEPVFRGERKRAPGVNQTTARVEEAPIEKAPVRKVMERPRQEFAPVAAPIVSAPAAVAVATEPERPAVPVRSVLFAEPEPEVRETPDGPGSRWVWVAAAFAVVALAVAGFVTRGAWMPADPPAPALRLEASDVEGKLLVRWNAAILKGGGAGELTIEDGGKRNVIPLDGAQVSRGFYLHARESGKAVVHMKAGASEEMVTFSGPVPEHKPTPEEIEKAKQEAKVKEDLQAQTVRNRQLQKRVKELSRKLEEQKP